MVKSYEILMNSYSFGEKSKKQVKHTVTTVANFWKLQKICKILHFTPTKWHLGISCKNFGGAEGNFGAIIDSPKFTKDFETVTWWPVKPTKATKLYGDISTGKNVGGMGWNFCAFVEPPIIIKKQIQKQDACHDKTLMKNLRIVLLVSKWIKSEIMLPVIN